MKILKDKGAVFAVCFMAVAGSFAWIKEGMNVFTIVCYSLALFILLIRTFAK